MNQLSASNTDSQGIIFDINSQSKEATIVGFTGSNTSIIIKRGVMDISGVIYKVKTMTDSCLTNAAIKLITFSQTNLNEFNYNVTGFPKSLHLVKFKDTILNLVSYDPVTESVKIYPDRYIISGNTIYNNEIVLSGSGTVDNQFLIVNDLTRGTATFNIVLYKLNLTPKAWSSCSIALCESTSKSSIVNIVVESDNSLLSDNHPGFNTGDSESKRNTWIINFSTYTGGKISFGAENTNQPALDFDTKAYIDKTTTRCVKATLNGVDVTNTIDSVLDGTATRNAQNTNRLYMELRPIIS